jgi:hypothetical protein
MRGMCLLVYDKTKLLRLFHVNRAAEKLHVSHGPDRRSVGFMNLISKLSN